MILAMPGPPDDRRQAIHETVVEFRPTLGENDARFLARVFATDTDVYAHRLAACGFRGCRRVLDAGCGFGQWSLGLARQNDAVEAVDEAPDRVRFLARLAERLGLANLRVSRGDLTALEFPDARFDGVFCYGVVFRTRWREALAELARVLAPGGVLYVNANGLGWYKHLWRDEPNRADDYDPREIAEKVLLNTQAYNRGEPGLDGIDVLIERQELIDALRAQGIDNVRTGGEGELVDEGFQGQPPVPFFQAEYLGDLGVYEVLARKPEGRSAEHLHGVNGS